MIFFRSFPIIYKQSNLRGFGLAEDPVGIEGSRFDFFCNPLEKVEKTPWKVVGSTEFITCDLFFYLGGKT